MKNTLTYLTIWLFSFTTLNVLAQSEVEFSITIDSKLFSKESVSGRMYVIMTPDLSKGDEIFWTSPINNEPIFSRSVTITKSNAKVSLNKSNTVSFPVSMNNIPEGVYLISAVLDMNNLQRHFAYARGNFISSNKIDSLKGGENKIIDLTLNAIYKSDRTPETEFIKLVSLRSNLLTKFYGDTTNLYAGIVLPPSYYKDSNKRYATVYVLPEFDNNHYDAFQIQEYLTRYKDLEKIYVVLNPLCDYGNHVFANSENNGPRAESIIQELIPHIEKKFRTVQKSSGRFLMGHSSGGWAALWLQISYPDFFGGSWATSPDPVDFRKFYDINIYDSTSNVFTKADGSARAFDRIPLDPPPVYKLFSDYEQVIIKGEQLVSHAASFSPKLKNQPQPLWNRETGKIDIGVAKHWQKYDIQYQVKKNIGKLKSKIDGKLHVYCGDNDDFFLDLPVLLLKESLTTLGVKAEIEILKDRGHSETYTDDIFDRMDKEINAKYLASQK